MSIFTSQNSFLLAAKTEGNSNAGKSFDPKDARQSRKQQDQTTGTGQKQSEQKSDPLTEDAQKAHAEFDLNQLQGKDDSSYTH